jgi:hypothetical protein
MKPSITGSERGLLPEFYHPVPGIGSNLFGSNFTIFFLSFFTSFSPLFPCLFPSLFSSHLAGKIEHRHRIGSAARSS